MTTDHRRAAPVTARHRLVILGLQLAHLAWFASTLGGGLDPVALAASGIVSGGLYAWFVVAEYRWNGYRATPILFYLGAGIFRLGTGVLFVVAAIVAEEWRFVAVGLYDVSAFLMHGHWLALLGDWCVVAGYFLVASRFRANPPRRPRSRPTCGGARGPSVSSRPPRRSSCVSRRGTSKSGGSACWSPS